MPQGYYAGVDLGATNVRAAIADEEGEMLAIERRDTPQGPRGVDVTEAMLEALRSVCAEVGIDPTTVEAAGIGSIGPLDLAAGTVEDPANLPDAIDRIPIRDPVSDLVGTDEVYLHNDTTAGVMGERFYSDPVPDDMVYVTISSGIGAGIAVDGDVISGWDGNAGEVGHFVIDPEGRRTCGCGKDGHWEAYCAGSHVHRYARQIHEEEGIETDLPIDDPEFAAPDVFDAPEDPLAAETIDRVAHWNAMGVTNLVHAYAPLVIAIGGAVALNNREEVIDPIEERVPDMVMSNVPEIRATELGADVILYGAVASALTGGTGTTDRR